MCSAYIIHGNDVSDKETCYNETMLEQKVAETIEKRALLENGAHIVLGVSGGPDSVCLLSVLSELSKVWDLKLRVVHIHHGLRGEEADGDQLYTQELCKHLEIPCDVFSYDVKKLAKEEGLTTEEMGRALRYAAFEKIRQEMVEEGEKAGKSVCARIAVAQNQNDQAETILMRILRGTGIDGLAGIEYIRDGVIIRPLLDANRKEIEDYCQRKNLHPRIDSTNLAPDYTRNKIRLELIPYLQKEYNENLLTGLCRLARSASEDKSYIYEQVDLAVETLVRDPLETMPAGNNKKTVQKMISRKGYRDLPLAIGKRVILKTLKEMGLLQDVTAIQLERADIMIRNGGTGDRIDFPHGFELRISYEDAVLEKKRKDTKKEKDFCYRVKLEETTEIPELNACLRVKVVSAGQSPSLCSQNAECTFLSAEPELWDQPLYIRTRQSGDYIKPLGMQGTKKIQNYFVDQKVPSEKRNQMPLLCRGQEVVWIVGSKINENYKVKKEAEKVVILEFIRPSC